MNKVSESIWSNKNVVIPMAEVSHIEKNHGVCEGITVIMKHSKWNAESQQFDPHVWLTKEFGNSDGFLNDWCFYRHEVEGGAEAFKGPE